MSYEPSVLRLVAVIATGQQDAGSWKTLHVLLLRVVYRLPEAAHMISRKRRMLHGRHAMRIHVRGHVRRHVSRDDKHHIFETITTGDL